MSHIVENSEAYFKKFVPPRDELLKALEQEADRDGIPIVGPVVGELLAILARITRAASILELGTATGYSAIYLARGCRAAKGRVVTLESSPDMASRAKKNFHKAGVQDQVEIRIGDALKEIQKMRPFLDLIFMDIEKNDYLRALPDCHRLLKTGGLLVADNVAFKDADDFNHAIFNDPGWQAVNLFSFLPLHSPEHDGLCLAVRL